MFRSGKLSNPPLTPPLIRGENHYRFKCYAALVLYIVKIDPLSTDFESRHMYMVAHKKKAER